MPKLSMPKLSIDEIISKLERREIFEATLDNSSLHIALNEYVPFICLALHGGGNIRKELRQKIALSKYERWYEEDPHTGDFISSLPIRITCCDSRYEYDLNRAPTECIYREAWGKDIWKEELTPKDKELSLEKYKTVYQLISKLVEVLEGEFNSCVIYDFHSYNSVQLNRKDSPLFNLGSANIADKFRPYVDCWLEELKSLSLYGIENITAENDVFMGEGYFIKYINQHFNNTLVLPTEIKKVYCDELTGDSFPEVVDELSEAIKNVVVKHAHYFLGKGPPA